MAPTKISVLIPLLRVKIGDLVPTNYRYLDDWLMTALSASVQSIWNRKYYIDDLGNVTRTSSLSYFSTDENIVGALEPRDRLPITINAAIIILQGGLENNAWNLSSWRDAEISFSNLESGRIMDSNLKSLFAELYTYITPPTKRLARTTSAPLSGYKYNQYETGNSDPDSGYHATNETADTNYQKV